MTRPRKALFLTVCLLALCSGLLAGCAAAPPAGSVTPAPAGAGLIVDVTGDAALKRQGWQDYAPATFGAALRRGDLVRVAGSGRAVVACADLNLAELSGGVKGYPCPPDGRAHLVFEGALVSPTRGDAGLEDYPLVLSPRKTRLLNGRPRLRWTAVDGAATYHVNLQGTAWETDVTGQTELVYPDNAPVLEPGKTYRLVVSVGGKSSLSEPGANLGFTLALPAEADQVRAEETRVRGLGVSDEAKRLLVANLYAGRQFYAEALQLLETPSQADRPALARLAGDIDLAIGLLRSAETAYAAALQASTAAGDREGQALASRGLGKVYALIGNPDEAARYYQQARAFYTSLGDRQAIAEIDAAMK